MISASKAKAQAVKGWERREQHEQSLVCGNISFVIIYSFMQAASGFSPETYASYISDERKSKKVDMPILMNLYERAIADTAKRLFNGDPNADGALSMFWIGYCDAMVPDITNNEI